jgi:alpha,alpha-trehalase
VAHTLTPTVDKAHTLAAGFYKSHPQYAANPKNASAMASAHTQAAAALKAGLLDLHWDASKLAFYDFILSSPTAASGNRTDLFSAATFYPYWNGIYPAEVTTNASAAYGAFASVGMVLARYNGTLPVTFLSTGQQWDAPNAWPPHQYIALEALRGLPANVTSMPWSTNGSSTFSLIPSGQLGVAESALPAQPLAPGTNASMSGAAADVNLQNGTVANGGNATAGEGWAAALQRALANRYVASALCSWQATGGSVPGLLPRLSDAALNVTASVNNTGNVRPAPLSVLVMGC